MGSLRISAQLPAITPAPVEMNLHEGSYRLPDTCTISLNLPGPEEKALVVYLQEQLKSQFGVHAIPAPEGKKGDIDIFNIRMPTSGRLAYRLGVTKEGVRIEANFSESAFHALQTLFQLIPANTRSREIPCLKIFDYPRFDYRGVHLDVGRHFFPLAFIKRYIDFLAAHKLNVFHWHLTEDQGWRIEIKKYPELTRTGAWRNGTIVGRYPGLRNDNIRYGGFYTQDEIREVVDYAKTRHIDVIPEIEMPGHSSAAIAAYPWLSCFPARPTAIPNDMASAQSRKEQAAGRIKLVQETWGIFDDVFCAGNDSVFLFLEGVLEEVIGLFPSKYVHIGGDECPKTHWKECPRCQQRIKSLGLKDEHELQSWFVQRIEKYLNSKGKILIGWDEILEGGLAPNAVVMSWRGEAGGIEAARQRHNVIMTPGNPVYFDHTQSEQDDSLTIGGYNPLEKVYAYEPIPRELNEEEGKRVLGAQANVWTEYMEYPSKVEYMLLPRLAALSEVLWSPKDKRNWQDFQQRLSAQLARYDSWNANYSKAFLEPRVRVIPSDESNKSVRLQIEARWPGSKIRLQKMAANAAALSRSGEAVPWTDTVIIVTETGRYGWQVTDAAGKRQTGLQTQDFIFSKATGKSIVLENQPAPSYPGDGAFTLVNGVVNNGGLARRNEWLGFRDSDAVAVVQLGEQTEIREASVEILQQPGSWIWAPAALEVWLSGDGQNWKKAGETTEKKMREGGLGTLRVSFAKSGARYVKVVAKHPGKVPAGNPGAGQKAWLFVSEIMIL